MDVGVELYQLQICREASEEFVVAYLKKFFLIFKRFILFCVHESFSSTQASSLCASAATMESRGECWIPGCAFINSCKLPCESWEPSTGLWKSSKHT